MQSGLGFVLLPLVGRKDFQLSKDWKIVINGNVENVYVNVTFNNVTIYNKSGGAILGSSKVKSSALEDRVVEKNIATPPSEPTLAEIARSLGRKLKDGVNENQTKAEFEVDGRSLNQAFQDVISTSNPNTNQNQTIAEWFDTLSEKGKGIGKFISYLRDSCGMDSVISNDDVTDDIKAEIDDFLAL